MELWGRRVKSFKVSQREKLYLQAKKASQVDSNKRGIVARLMGMSKGHVSSNSNAIFGLIFQRHFFL